MTLLYLFGAVQVLLTLAQRLAQRLPDKPMRVSWQRNYRRSDSILEVTMNNSKKAQLRQLRLASSYLDESMTLIYKSARSRDSFCMVYSSSRFNV